MIFNISDNICNLADSAVLRGLRRMTALGSDAHRKVSIALFCNTDARKVALENMLDIYRQYGTALVNNTVAFAPASLEATTSSS